jgi:hypothetical protein
MSAGTSLGQSEMTPTNSASIGASVHSPTDRLNCDNRRFREFASLLDHMVRLGVQSVVFRCDSIVRDLSTGRLRKFWTETRLPLPKLIPEMLTDGIYIDGKCYVPHPELAYLNPLLERPEVSVHG